MTGPKYLCDECQSVHYTHENAFNCHHAGVEAYEIDVYYYNGYASQDAFHAALRAGAGEYARARQEAFDRGEGEGWRHAGCDHAYGICSG
jgi:hypothetical protein